MLDLKRLRNFIAVADELHFGRAAEKLHVAQPPLTRQISLLEAEIGFQLFSRTSRTVTLTEAGRQFVPYARAVLDHGLRAEEFARRLSKGTAGTLTFGYSTSICPDERLSTSIRAVGRQFTDVHWTFVELPSKTLNEEVAAGRIDIAVSRIAPDSRTRGIQVEKQISERLVVAVGSDDPLCSRESIHAAELQDRPLILADEGPSSGLNAQLVAVLDRWGTRMTRGQTAPQIHSILTMVAAGLGVALVPESFSGMCRLGVRYIPIENAAYLHSYVVRKDGDPVGAAGRLLQALSNCLCIDRPSPVCAVPLSARCLQSARPLEIAC
jgi:DNA-binding transcriptional LysR family regulator